MRGYRGFHCSVFLMGYLYSCLPYLGSVNRRVLNLLVERRIPEGLRLSLLNGCKQGGGVQHFVE